jgi:hypothetical protein
LTPESSGSILKLPEVTGKNMPRNKLDPNEPHAAPQVTLRGRSAYILLELAQSRGGELADSARWIIDRWINGEGRTILKEQFGIDVLAYGTSRKVVSIDRKKNEGGRE